MNDNPDDSAGNDVIAAVENATSSSVTSQENPVDVTNDVLDTGGGERTLPHSDDTFSLKEPADIIEMPQVDPPVLNHIADTTESEGVSTSHGATDAENMPVIEQGEIGERFSASHPPTGGGRSTAGRSAKSTANDETVNQTEMVPGVELLEKNLDGQTGAKAESLRVGDDTVPSVNVATTESKTQIEVGELDLSGVQQSNKFDPVNAGEKVSVDINQDQPQQPDKGTLDVTTAMNQPHAATAENAEAHILSKDHSNAEPPPMEPEVAQPMSENTDSTPVDRQLTPVQKTVKPEIRPLGPDEVAADLSKWFRKMYLGGFRDKRTGIEYFHAFSQTPTAQELKDAKAAPKFHRDTQTKYERNRLSQSTKETATQMTKSGVYVTSEKDCIIVPRPYFSAEEYHRMIVRKVIVIQCFVRKCFALRLVRKLREDRDRRLKALAAKELRRRQLAEKRRKKELESRLHPKTAKDFEILYNGLENWRIQEIEKINRAGYSEPARLAALADLMDQEAVLIQKIDKLRQSAMEENREKAIAKLLEQMASPKKWPVYKGGYVSVDTPDTIRARELRDLYHAVNVAQVSVDERLQILLHVKYTVKEFDCSLTREIVELIDREGDLMSRGRDPKTMEAHYQKFPEAGQAWKRDQAVYYCRGCTKYLPSTEFYLSTTMKHLGRCKRCTQNENMANHRKDDSVYAAMLKDVRQQEAKWRARGWGFGGDVGDVDVDDAHYN
ncbi:hypothetical protein HK405_010784, partial [Cladochytrium tenue]